MIFGYSHKSLDQLESTLYRSENRYLKERKKKPLSCSIFFDGNPWFHPSGIGLDVIEFRYSGKSEAYLYPDRLWAGVPFDMNYPAINVSELIV